jgi:transcriptional antiterminator RfaH
VINRDAVQKLISQWRAAGFPVTTIGPVHARTNLGILKMKWYLVRTKSGKEKWVHNQLSAILSEVFLPLLETRIPRWGKLVWSIMPLFPCYVFAQFDLETRYFDVKYIPGVQGIVSAGRDPLSVPIQIVEDIKRRSVDGVVKIEQNRFDNGERVRVVEGPFRGLEAIFQRYHSGAERVTILLSDVEAYGQRVVLPSSAVAKCL